MVALAELHKGCAPRSLATRAPGAEAPPEHVYVALTLLSLVEVCQSAAQRNSNTHTSNSQVGWREAKTMNAGA